MQSKGLSRVFSNTTVQSIMTHSSTLAWKIPRTEEPGRLQSMALCTTSLFHSLALTRTFPSRCVVAGGLLGGSGNLALQELLGWRKGRWRQSWLHARSWSPPPVAACLTTCDMRNNQRKQGWGWWTRKLWLFCFCAARKQLQGGLKGSAVGPRTPTSATGELAHNSSSSHGGGGVCTDLGLVISG